LTCSEDRETIPGVRIVDAQAHIWSARSRRATLPTS